MNEYSSVESWVLMSLIYRDLDDKDYNNALLLSERLFAIDNQNSYYRFLYGTCLFQTCNYSGSYLLLRNDKSLACLNLFAKSCAFLLRSEKDEDKRESMAVEAIQALTFALNQPAKTLLWADELSSVQRRHHEPSRSSLYNLLGDLYLRLDNVRAATKAYKNCLDINPYKLSAYFKLCDLASDVMDFDQGKAPSEIFKDLPPTLSISSSLGTLPSLPNSECVDLVFEEKKMRVKSEEGFQKMPDFKEEFEEVTLADMKDVITYELEFDDYDLTDEEHVRGEIEVRKDMMLDYVENDINKGLRHEQTKSRHGLHKSREEKAPLHVEKKYPNIDVNQVFEEQESNNSSKNNPSSFIQKRSLEHDELTPFKCSKRLKLKEEKHVPKNETISQVFLPTTQNNTIISKETHSQLIEGMNRVMKLLRVMASGYLFQSLYYDADSVTELKQLNTSQYESARVLCLLGKAYYNAGEYHSAWLFFRRSFYIAPWFCDYATYYSTCLWYLQYSGELNLLAYTIKDNQFYRYESYIVAGNWEKCTNHGSGALHWFKKAAEEKPDDYYAHALLGFEESEREQYIAAMQNFKKSIITNKRSYIGWFGLANCYRSLGRYKYCEVLLREAIRLNPRQPVILATLSEIMYKLGFHDEAIEWVDKSLDIKFIAEYAEMKEKIVNYQQL
ncbi:unnamed protein product [Rhizopus stolonifer]